MTPSLAAISALVSPSIFQTATVRNVLVPQAVEQSPALVGHQGGELGGRLLTQNLLDVQFGLLPERPSPPPLPGCRASPRQVNGLAPVMTNRIRQVVAPSSSGNWPRSARR